jgi:hypothetical protein
VAKVAKAGRLGAAVAWETKGSKRFGTVVNLPLALQLWSSRPGAHVPALAASKGVPTAAPASSAGAADSRSPDVLDAVIESRRQLDRFKALREQLEYEARAGRLIEVDRAVQIFGRQISEAKTAILAIGQKARGRCTPELTVDQVAVIEALSDEALEGLAAGAIRQHQSEGST